ncbi:MAG: DUF2207 domain-containing protein [Erysipelotrichaceae bacterium]|nr:DUF2207 domain-containing protein [Erysipelotrichaceae bacterium]
MKHIKRVLILLCCLCIPFFSINVEAAEDFYINNLDITIIVKEDGVLTVRETYGIYFRSPRRGFYRTIPTKYEMNWDIDGKEVKKNYYFPVKNINTYETESKIERRREGVVIRLGDPDQYVKGSQKYEIEYEVHMRDLDLDGKQMLYWNLIGDGFDTHINNFSFHINMPKEFDANQVAAYSGVYGSTQSNIEISVDGKRISGSNIKKLKSNEAVTIKVDLEDGYFTFKKPLNYAVPIVLSMLAVFIIVILFFRKYIKKDDMIVTVEFKAPDGLSSAEIGYIVDGIVDDKDIFSLIIEWARRGYIIIHEEDEKFSLEKIKDLEKTCPRHERVFFESLFVKDKTIVTQEDLKAERIQWGLRGAKTAMQMYFQEESRKIFLKKSFRIFATFMGECACLPSVLLVFSMYIGYYDITELPFIAMAGIIVVLFILMFQYKKRYAMKKQKFKLNRTLCILTLCILVGFIFIELNNNYPEHLMFHIGYCILTGLFTYLMLHTRSRTEEGHRKFCKILGLREFIETCEQEKLELLVKENPSAFFDILPYAYVLGLSNVWADKFENIAMEQPDWYQTDVKMRRFSTVLWWSTFHTSFVASSLPKIEFNGNSGSGGGRMSGGFSGGFSGGGFGGGGGGSW